MAEANVELLTIIFRIHGGQMKFQKIKIVKIVLIFYKGNKEEDTDQLV